jgi:undecaprenyl-diphosphatase
LEFAVEHLNLALFLLLNAGQSASGITIDAAGLLAQDLVWIVPAVLIVGWLRSSSATRQGLVAAAAAALAGLAINQFIGLVWYQPRPFEIGLGRTLIRHVQDSTFPSDHLTLIWAVAFSLLMHRQTRLAGWALTAMGLPVAWARIYLGVHFPLDILGSALVALVIARLVLWQEQRLIVPLTRLLLSLYQVIFADLIRRGWVVR